MDIILVHIGKEPPKYQEVCIKQAQYFSKGNIIEWQTDEQKSAHSPKIREFLNCQHFRDFGMNNFWLYCALRLYVVEEVMIREGINKALHLENDNLIYDDPENTELDKLCGESVGIPQLTENELCAGVMYVGSLEALSKLTEAMTALVRRGKQNLTEQYGPLMLQEMRLLKIIQEENPGVITILPSMPGNYKHLFDCESWGQWVGGIHQNPGVPWAGGHHIVGRELLAGKYNVVWENRGEGIVPLVEKEYGIRCGDLFNLHIHSKQLERWKSYDR